MEKGDCTGTWKFCHVPHKTSQSLPKLVTLDEVGTHMRSSHICLICVVLSHSLLCCKGSWHQESQTESFLPPQACIPAQCREDLLNLPTIVTHTILTCHPRNWQCSYGNMICQLRTPPQKLSSLLGSPWEIAGGTKETGWVDTVMDLWPFIWQQLDSEDSLLTFFIYSERKAPILVDILNTDYHDC